MPRTCILRPALVLAAALAIAAPASALFVGVNGTYEEDFGFGATPDTYALSNDALSESTIVTVVIDLSTSVAAAVFDPAGSPFVVLGTDSVGFDGHFALTGTQTLTLTFTGFDPGETFIFGVETDDGNGLWTTGADFAGASLTAIWAVSEVVSGFFAETGGATAVMSGSQLTPVPEPGSFATLGLGLTALAALQRRIRAELRSERR